MATPTRSQTASTPKPHLSTPNRLMASPRPGTSGNPNRPLAYKSPAVKTPASAQGHGHHFSVSSQPSSTPLAGVAIHDELLALTSPATALIASLGPTGMTPLGGGGDGLGITTNLQGSGVRPTAGPVNPEIERLQRVQLVAETLKSRLAGHGVTREGVERIAQLQGFTTLWDDENLTIAGNTVDLEVMFHAGDRDRVRDVSLKLNPSDSEEPQLQERGTRILKDNLKPLSTLNGTPQWTSLDTFESNLQYLSELDHIEGGVPCFEAVDNLYDAFQKIWNAEKDMFKGKSAQQRLGRNAIGRTSMDRTPRLGLCLDYWITKQDVQQPAEGKTIDTAEDPANLYSARISCEPGAPSTIVTRHWLSDQVFMQDAQAKLGNEAENLKPSWLDPSHDQGSSMKAEAGEPSLEKPVEVVPSVLDMHFVCSLLPEVYLPLTVAANLNMELTMLEMDQELTVTYQMALQEHFNATKASGAKSISEERWPRSLPTNTDSDPLSFRRHSYALHSAQHAAPLWCYPVKQLRFTHPRQLATVLPVLRQYALVWSILRSLVDYGTTGPEHESVPLNSTARGTQTRLTARPAKRSNRKAVTSSLDDFLGANGTTASDDVLPVDLSLDVISDISRARLDLYVPLNSMLAKGRKSPFIFVSLNICQGGEIEIKDLRGMHSPGEDDTNLRQKILRILTATEDVGLLVEWLIEQVRLHD